MEPTHDLLRKLPSVDQVLQTGHLKTVLEACGREAAVEAVRAALARLRAGVLAGAVPPAEELEAGAVAADAARLLERQRRPRLRRVVNATGGVLHTNLGRALLAPEAVDAVVDAAREPCNLEFDLDGGGRGERDHLVEEHLCRLTGAEAATVVNNNAAAVVLTLHALAAGREVVVSRGELIEIGGSFRIPDIMAHSGALLREVGTTNRTHLRDFEQGIGEATALLLKVHTSNYRIVGFTSAVELQDLVGLARRHNDLLVVEDLGAGALIDMRTWGGPDEPVVRERIEAGADVVTFSGDKLLGGPQCGIIAGKAAAIERIRRNPLKRALRCDKMTLAALEATLSLYRFAPDLRRRLPVLAALGRDRAELEDAALRVQPRLQEALGPEFSVEIVRSAAQAGSGSQPEVELDSIALAVTSGRWSADAVARRFREADPPIIGRIERDRFLLDLRSVVREDDLIPGA
jgi:L-seryl-tRNA(Ser) seleniumtransferase